MRKIGLIVGTIFFSFLISNVFAIDWDISLLKPGKWINKIITFSSSINQNCTLRLENFTSDVIFPSLPSSIDFNTTNPRDINIFVLLSDSPTRDEYIGWVIYENTTECVKKKIRITVNRTIEAKGGCSVMEDIFVTIYGSKKPGGKIRFFIQNKSSTGVPATIDIVSATSGNPEQLLECPTGICDYDIPPNENGPLMLGIRVPSCSAGILPKQIDLYATETQTGENLIIGCPETLKINKEFACSIRDKNAPVEGVSAQIVNIGTGYGKTGITNSWGYVSFELKEAGSYELSVSKTGYNSSKISLTVELPDCIYECCINEQDYKDKGCEAEYECIENKCEPKKKEKIWISCPTPEKGKQISCRLYDKDNEELALDVSGELQYDNMSTPISFTGGTVDLISPDRDFSIVTEETGDYQSAKFSYAYSINWIPAIVAVVVIFVLLIVGIIYLKRRGKRPIGYPTSEAEFEEVVPL